jgi:membrane protease YdiL (CAAX protease family)
MAGVSRVRALALTSGLCLLLGALSAGGLRVSRLVASELEHEGSLASLSQRAGERGATRISARLTEVTLEAGELTTFEVCAVLPPAAEGASTAAKAAGSADLADPRYAGALDFVVWREADQKLELKVGLDAAHRALVKHRAGASCLTLGGGTVASRGRYALDAVWAGRTLSPELAALPLRARVLAKQPLALRDGVLVLSAALGAMLCVLAGFVPDSARARQPPARRASLWALGLGLLGALLFRLSLSLPLTLAASGLVRGLLISVLELALALLGARLAFAQARGGLNLFAPERRATEWLFVACAGALCLRLLSHWALRLVPSTGEAPIEAFIAWPSGALSFALLGMAVPLAEELFFRGFVYGALRGLGPALAAGGSLGLFVLAHAQQVWGNWGALLSLTLTGGVLTLLRALSGSTLVPAVAHLLFNLSLWRDSFSS